MKTLIQLSPSAAARMFRGKHYHSRPTKEELEHANRLRGASYPRGLAEQLSGLGIQRSNLQQQVSPLFGSGGVHGPFF